MIERRQARLHVFPDAERVEHAMLQAASDTARLVDGRSYCTFAQLIETLADKAKTARRLCSPLTARVVLWSTARALPSGPFGDFVEEPGFARSAFTLVQDLKAGGIAVPEFAAAVRHLPPARALRGRFLADLYSSYETELQRRQLLDRSDLVRVATEALISGAASAYVSGFAEITLRDIYDFSPARLRFLLALAKVAEAQDTLLRVEIPASGAPAVDAAVDSVLAQVERQGQLLSHLEVSKRDYSRAPFAALASLLYANAPHRPRPEPNFTIFSAASPREETREIARRIRECVDDGAPPEGICVAYRDLGPESEWLEERISELGISVHLRRGAPLVSTTLGRLALDIPLLVDDAYPAKALSKLLSSRYALGAQSQSPGRLLAMAAVRDNRIGAVADRGAYAVRLGALAERLERRGGRAQASQCRDLLRRCSKLIEICDSISEQGRIGDLLRRWWRSVEKLGMFKAIREAEPRAEEDSSFGREVLRAIARDQAAAESLKSMASEFDAALRLSGATHHRLSRRLFHRWLLDASMDFNLIPKSPKGGAVRIHGLLEIPGLDFDRVFVGGLVDGRFPRRDQSHSLFPDEDRAVVNRALQRDAFRLSAGEGETRMPWGLAEDRLLFFTSVASASKGATLSFARTGTDGRESIPSPFVEEAKRVFGVEVSVRKLQTVPAARDLQTESDLRERIALEALSLRELHSETEDGVALELGKRVKSEPWFRSASEIEEIEEERLRFFSSEEAQVGLFSGYVSPQAQKELDAAFEFGPFRPLSASLLGKFGNCGYQGFLAHGLRLEEVDLPGEEMDAKDQGSLWHRVVEGLFRRLSERGLVGKPIEEIPSSVIDEAVDVAAEETEASGHVGHPILWALGRERARRMAMRFLSSAARGLPFEGQTPVHLELTFGRADSPAEWRTVMLPAGPGEREIYFEGKIDRVDRGEQALGVLDYKTSLPRKVLDNLLSTEFQLPLYLYASRSAGHRGSVSAAWVSLKDGRVTLLDDSLAQASLTFDSLLTSNPKDRATIEAFGGKNFANAVHRLVAEMRNGRFPARPQDCSFCSYRAVCRISERRIPEMDLE